MQLLNCSEVITGFHNNCKPTLHSLVCFPYVSPYLMHFLLHVYDGTIVVCIDCVW